MEQNFLKLIDTAISREAEAYDFYTDIHNRVDDAGTKDTLKFIAGEEKKHKEFLVNFRESGYGPDAMRLSDVVYYKIAEYQEEPDVSGDMNSVDVYLVAAHREARSHQFYTELAGQCPDGDAKDMLLKMANEELKHKEKMEYLYTNAAYPQTSGG